MDDAEDYGWKSIVLSDVTAADLIDVAAPDSEVSPHPHHCEGKLRPTTYVHGRETEITFLKETWNRVSSDSSASSELVWLLGASGTGKSFLTEALRSHVLQTNNGIFVSSKFDQLTFSRREPFYAIVAALSDICEIVAADASFQPLHVASEIRGVLGNDLGFFSRLVPTIKQLLGSEGDWDDSSLSGSDDRTASSLLTTIKACKSFLACVTRHRPLFLVLDDIQWSDSDDSLKLIQALISDLHSKNICYVLAAREGHPVTEHYFTVAKSPLPTHFSNGDIHRFLPFTTVKIGNLNIANVDEMIRGFLECPDSVVTTTLARIVFQKTNGNPFFVTQFLQLLYVKNLLTYSEEDGFWCWETEDKIALLDVSSDVVLSIEARVNCLNAMTRAGLQVAAHLGFRFRIDVFETVMSSIYRRAYSNEDEPTRRQRFNRVVESAEKESMIIRAGDGNEMCFMHDRVQQCLYEMVPEGEPKARMCLTIGRTLRSKAKTEPHLTFLIADLFNAGRSLIEDAEQKQWLIDLDMEASKLSVEMTSFSNSSHYLKNAISLADESSIWSEDYDTALNLWSSLAWSSCNANDFEECQRAFDVVTSNSRDPLDKHRAYQALMLSCIVQGKMDETVSIGLGALEEVGLRISRRPSLVSLSFETFRVRSRLLKMPESNFISLPKIEEGSQEAFVLDILGRMHLPMAMRDDKLLVHQAHLLIVRYSLKHGLSPQTPFGIANFGVLECALKNFKQSSRLGMLANEMTEHMDVGKEVRCDLSVALYGMVLPWSSPWIDMLDPLWQAGEMGREHGVFLGSSIAFGIACVYIFLTEPSLSRVAEQCSQVVEIYGQMHDKTMHVKYPKVIWQQSLNLLGRGDNHVELNGEVMMESELAGDAVPASFLVHFYSRKLELASYFRSQESAMNYTEKLEKTDNLGGAQLLCASFVPMKFFCALTYVDLARKRHRTRKNLHKAGKALKWLTSILQKGCVDAKPFRCILSAELMEMRRVNLKKLRTAFDEAIDVALHHGFHGIASLACERAYYVLHDHLSYEETRSYWSRCVDLYTEWEAFGKVEALRRTGEAKGMSDMDSSQPPVEVGLQGFETSELLC